jgi:hypothetical protein
MIFFTGLEVLNDWLFYQIHGVAAPCAVSSVVALAQGKGNNRHPSESVLLTRATEEN